MKQVPLAGIERLDLKFNALRYNKTESQKTYNKSRILNYLSF